MYKETILLDPSKIIPTAADTLWRIAPFPSKQQTHAKNNNNKNEIKESEKKLITAKTLMELGIEKLVCFFSLFFFATEEIKHDQFLDLGSHLCFSPPPPLFFFFCSFFLYFFIV